MSMEEHKNQLFMELIQITINLLCKNIRTNLLWNL